MIKKITLHDFDPFKPTSTLNFKKLNLIIGKNGVGKTRLFKTISQSSTTHKKIISKSMKFCASIQDDKGNIKKIYGEPSQNYFTLVGLKTVPYYYIQDKRVPYSADVNNARLDIKKLEEHLFSNYLFYPECIDFTNKIYKKIFNRTIDTRKISTDSGPVDRCSYKINDKLINPTDDGFGIIQSLGIFQVLFLAKKNSTVVIEEPTANLHPSAIVQIMDEILSYANTKNIQLIIITQDIVTALRFFHKISNGDKDTTIHRFEQIDGTTHIHNTDKDTITSSLEDFLGKFPEENDITLLKKIAGFTPDLK